ncbi:sensor histidine kinase [Anditalea andensis]|uniref:Signal transduction histidine kinase internal region domain-containing protein n=1 Tax=Anditalea andensis TaxID=1048983 RepID=A0A074LDV3_9BACT|nr:sensor histidine kinase [Anditalea andensis]KEO71972.1 hypothetical protein EL17_20880 [Anditalea andensis]
MKLKSYNMDFPQVFELGVWLIYVCLYKYSYYSGLTPTIPQADRLWPFPELILYAIFLSVYFIPFYRIIIPRFLATNKHLGLLLVTIVYVAFISKISNLAVNYLFMSVRGESDELYRFYYYQWQSSLNQAKYIFAGWNLDVLVTDLIAFSSIAFVRFAFENERRRYNLEKENLQLQFDVLKTQLQPHFLFNTLNSIYSLSLKGAAETPRFIMLLSDMMRHILYNSSKELVPLKDEIVFLQNYMEMEQKRYPQSTFTFQLAVEDSTHLSIPPLLLLPLIENSFKHGSHRLVDQAYVNMVLKIEKGNLCFSVENSVYKNPMTKQEVGGIGLPNIRKRLQLYYPHTHQMLLKENEDRFLAELTLTNL